MEAVYRAHSNGREGEVRLPLKGDLTPESVRYSPSALRLAIRNFKRSIGLPSRARVDAYLDRVEEV